MAKSHYQRVLEEKIAAEFERQAGMVATGYCVDYAAYRFDAGYLHGLRKALELAEETEKEVG